MTTPFVGPSYNLDSRPASVQRTVNLVPVPLEPGNERTGWVFKDAPGLTSFVPGAGSTTQLQAALLDQWATGIWAAYAMKRLFTFYFGPLIRVKRASDSTELDINYDSNGNFDTASFNAFVGASSATIVKWYDQTNNGHHSVPAVSGTTVTSTAVSFGGNGSALITTAVSSARPSFTSFLRCTATLGVNANYFFLHGDSANSNTAFVQYNGNVSTLESIIYDTGSINNGVGYGSLTSVNHTFGVRWDRTQASVTSMNAICLDGTFLTGTTPSPEGANAGTVSGDFAAKYWRLGGLGGLNDMQMDVTCFLIYEAALSNADMVSIAALMP